LLGPVEGPHGHHTLSAGSSGPSYHRPERGTPLDPEHFEAVLQVVRLSLLIVILALLVGFIA
jgi:hypothetical protein